MILNRKRKYPGYKVYRMPGNFWAALDGIKVSTHTFHTVFEPYENSWETMVALRTPRDFLTKETSLLTSSGFL